jgi:hypothetical protein
LGVFVLSLFQLIFAGAFSGLVWYAVIKREELADDKQLRIASYVAGGVYSLLAVAAFLGLIGAIIRSRPLVAIYSTVLYAMIAISTAAGIWFIIALYRDGDKLRANCANQVDKVQDSINDKTPTVGNANTDLNLNTDDICDSLFKTAKWSFIVTLVVSTLIELYCAYIVSQYVRQLSEEQSYKSAQRNWAGTAPPAPTAYGNVAATSYYPHQPLAQQNESLLHPKTGYAYTDKEHSFGHQRGTSKESIV